MYIIVGLFYVLEVNSRLAQLFSTKLTGLVLICVRSELVSLFFLGDSLVK